MAAIYVSLGAAPDTWVTPAMDVCVVDGAGRAAWSDGGRAKRVSEVFERAGVEVRWLQNRSRIPALRLVVVDPEPPRHGFEAEEAIGIATGAVDAADRRALVFLSGVQRVSQRQVSTWRPCSLTSLRASLPICSYPQTRTPRPVSREAVLRVRGRPTVLQ